MKFRKIIDISLPLYTGMITYPLNPHFETEPLKTKTSFLTKITLGTHTGTHVDVPCHVFKNGMPVDKMALKIFFGPVRVLDLTRVKTGVGIRDLIHFKIKKGERILVKTMNSLRGFKRFYNNYVYLESEAATHLAKKGIKLFGIDSLSIKKRGSIDNRPHTELLKKGIPIIEGLNLKNVREGNYFIAAFPLRLKGLDGSPVRALLLA